MPILIKNSVGLNKKAAFLRLSIFIFGFMFSISTFMLGHEVWGGIISIGVLVVVSMYLSNMDILHPLMWFTPLFFVYSIAYPVLVALGELPYTGNLRETLFIQWIALLTFVIVFSFHKNKKYSYDVKPLVSIQKIAFPVYIVSFLLTLIYVGSVFSKGLTSKYEIALYRSPLKSLLIFFSIYILSFIVLVVWNIMVNKKIPKKLILFTLIYTLLVLFILGERDLILKVLLVLLLLTHVLYKKISKKRLIAFAICGVLLVPILGDMKNYAVAEKTISLNEQSIVSTILSSEFAAASKNLNELLNHRELWSYFYGETFIWDLQVVLGNGISPGLWYNNTFFPNLVSRGGGNGFTLVGEGLINFGLFGVILVFTLLAFLLRYLYSKASKNIIWLTIYIASIPIFIYTIRGDLATLFTQVGKQIILPLLFMVIVKQILSKRDAENN